jgi:Mg/Co/Ni transporter MgtE
VALQLDEVRLVEGRDGLKNGFFIGSASGAVAGGLLFGWAASTFYEGGVEGVAVLFGAASGIAVGGLLGAMVDGLIPGKQSLFERTGSRVIPILSSGKKAIGITVDWR